MHGLIFNASVSLLAESTRLTKLRINGSSTSGSSDSRGTETWPSDRPTDPPYACTHAYGQPARLPVGPPTSWSAGQPLLCCPSDRFWKVGHSATLFHRLCMSPLANTRNPPPDAVRQCWPFDSTPAAPGGEVPIAGETEAHHTGTRQTTQHDTGTCPLLCCVVHCAPVCWASSPTNILSTLICTSH